jgi:hypothetical protein
MPEKAEALWQQLGAPGTARGTLFAAADSIDTAGWRVAKGEALFPRKERN